MNQETPSTIPPIKEVFSQIPLSDTKIHTNAGEIDRDTYKTLLSSVQSPLLDLTKGLSPGDPFSNTGKLQRRIIQICIEKGLDRPTDEMIKSIRAEINRAIVKKYGRSVESDN
jgi:hypothetical protein